MHFLGKQQADLNFIFLSYNASYLLCVIVCEATSDDFTASPFLDADIGKDNVNRIIYENSHFITKRNTFFTLSKAFF